MSEDTSLKSPSELLAERIASALVDQKLLLVEDAKRIRPYLASGKMKAEDWRLLAEKALDKEENNG